MHAMVQLKGNVALAARHTLALDVYNVEFYSFATQKSLYTSTILLKTTCYKPCIIVSTYHLVQSCFSKPEHASHQQRGLLC